MKRLAGTAVYMCSLVGIVFSAFVLIHGGMEPDWSEIAIGVVILVVCAAAARLAWRYLMLAR
jgi:hypothetical protein